MVELKYLSSSDLEQIMENYPWFTAARCEYIFRQGGETKDEESIQMAARRACLFLPSRKEFTEIIGRRLHGTKPEPAVKVEEKPRKSYYTVGGDYFSKEDFQQLESQGLAVDVPSFKSVSATETSIENNPAPAPEKNQKDDFFTETLANIYADQEFYQRAIEIYEKLILLYPKKSAYFASLIEKIKNSN